MKIESDEKLGYLNDGSAVIIRRLRESDRIKLLDGFDALSQLSRYRRFLHNKNDLKHAEIDCLFNTTSHRGVSYIALECNNVYTRNEGRCIGLIQLIELESIKASAEVALVVIDEFHNCGLGKQLLNTIHTQALQRNFDTLYFYTTSDNKPLSAMLDRIGWDITIDREFGSVTIISKLQNNIDTNSVRPSLHDHPAQKISRVFGLNSGQKFQCHGFLSSCLGVYLRMIVLMNQFNLNLYKRRKT